MTERSGALALFSWLPFLIGGIFLAIHMLLYVLQVGTPELASFTCMFIGGAGFAAGGVVGGVGGGLVGGPVGAAAGTAGGAGTGAFLANELAGSAAGCGSTTGNLLDEMLITERSVRQTSLYPHLLLSADSGEKTVRGEIQAAFYPDPCTSCLDRTALKNTVSDIIGDERTWKIIAKHQGHSVEVQDGSSFSSGPAEYTMPLPLPGGQTVQFTLLVDGSPALLRWTR